jgi:hypothetical protein
MVAGVASTFAGAGLTARGVEPPSGTAVYKGIRLPVQRSPIRVRRNTGLSMVVFESEDAANGASERIRANAPAGVTIEDVEVREVLARA